MPACVEGAVYLHHLATKRKPIAEPHTLLRVAACCEHECPQPGCGVASWFRELQRTSQVTPAMLGEARRLLEARLGISFDDGNHVSGRKRPGRMGRPAAVCVQGVDGSGKTTLVEALAAAGAVDSILIGKKLYRRSWLYQLLSRRSGSTREAFDERLCVALAIRAGLTLRLRLLGRAWRRRGTLLIDRSLMDFVYRGRKTDNGSLHPFAATLSRYAPQPAIHLVAPYEAIRRRKAEVTPLGHSRYDLDMLESASRSATCDHLVFHNGGPASASVAQLRRYLADVLLVRSADRVDPG
jgi:predicted ATPase